MKCKSCKQSGLTVRETTKMIYDVYDDCTLSDGEPLDDIGEYTVECSYCGKKHLDLKVDWDHEPPRVFTDVDDIY